MESTDPKTMRAICCNSLRKAQATSWLLTIWYGFALMAVIIFCINFGKELADASGQIPKDDAEKTGISAAVCGLFLLIMVNVTGFVAGGILVDGVRQGDPRKLKIWIMLSVPSLVLYFIHMIYITFTRRYGTQQRKYDLIFQSTDFLFILIAIHFISIYIVHTHRQELLTTEDPCQYECLEEENKVDDKI